MLRTRFSSRLGGLLLATLTLLPAGCSRPAAEGPPRHLFLITVDTLRADRMGFAGYPRDTTPNLDRLAAEGVVFERAISQWPKTGPSFASIFTGQYPQTTGITHKAAVRLPEEYLTLPELAAEAGYTSLAVVSNGVLAQRLDWNQGFTEYLETWKLTDELTDDPAEYRKWLNARRVNELAVPLLERRKDDARLFVWLHYSDPHAPYLLPEDVENPFLGDRYDTGEAQVELDNPRATALGDHTDLRYYVAQYDANVWFADQQIGAILDHARSLGLLDDAMVIFTSDHGESLGEHGYYFGHGRLPYNPGAHVPLFFWAPGRLPAARVAAPVELVDLYPTLRQIVAPELDVPGLEGKSLEPLLAAASDEPATAESFQYAFSQAGGGTPTTHFRSVQDAGWKLVYHPELAGWGPARLELYNLAEDPGETRNLVDERPPALRRLHGELFGWMEGSEWIRRSKQEQLEHNEETLKALKALGYVN